MPLCSPNTLTFFGLYSGKKKYTGPFKTKAKAASYDEAARKILHQLISKQRKLQIFKWHRFEIVNTSTHKKKYYLVDDDEVHKCDSFVPSNLDHAGEYYLKEACKGIGANFTNLTPQKQQTYTKEQAMVKYLAAHSSSYSLWCLLMKNDVLRALIFGQASEKDIYIRTVSSGKGIQLGIYGESKSIIINDSLFQFALHQNQNENKIEPPEPKEQQIEVDLLKRKVKMLEKSIIKLELENERLRWQPDDLPAPQDE